MSDGLEVDPQAMDALVKAFAECRELGIEVSPAMPLGEPAHQRAAVMFLSREILRYKGMT